MIPEVPMFVDNSSEHNLGDVQHNKRAADQPLWLS
jgi:hypothetical protein